MTKLNLLFSAALEGVERIKPSQEMEFYFKIKCMNCQESHGSVVSANTSEVSKVKGSRGSASLVISCHFCKRENSLDIINTPFDSCNSLLID